jgi:16S rRNA processing protein RimM
MSRTHLVEIGIIKRIHGVSGEVQVLWLPNVIPNEKNLLESVFIVIDGIPVPFFITSIRGNNADMAIVRFDEIDSADDAAEFVGATILANKSNTKETEELYFDDLVGYTILDGKGSLVGLITGFEEYATNAIFMVKGNSGQEIILPAAPELIISINEDTKTLTLQVPEGLIDIYLG